MDADLLLNVTMPAVVCASDKKFVKHTRTLKSDDRFRVMTPEELMQWLKTGSTPK
jgi:hypothetical protein